MRRGHASRTAQHNALFRALESALPESRRLFADPLARHFLDWPLGLVARPGAVPGLRDFAPWFIDRNWPGVRTSVTARTRLIDDAIAETLDTAAGTLDAGIEQVVILGAGFDTRAYRLPALARRRVFEVDHPDTQAAKRAVLARALPAPPAHVRFVASDFRSGDLERAMAEAGYRELAPTFFLWEGVTHYLDEPSVDATLRWCARAAPQSPLIFTYVHRDILTHPERFAGTKALFAALERAGEQFRFGLDPQETGAFLAVRGLRLESDVGAARYRERYYGAAARRMRGHEFYRVATARVEDHPSTRVEDHPS